MIPIDTGDFRLMSRRFRPDRADAGARSLHPRHGGVGGFKQVAFEYDRQQRFAGETKYPLSKMLSFAADAFLGYSMTLLRFSSIAALRLLVVLVLVAIYSL